MQDIFATRTVGETKLSIGTHLALETFFHNKMLEVYDKDREFEKLDPNKYTHHVFNIYTIIRNILHSITETNVKEQVLLHSDFIPTLKTEIDIISKMYKSTKCTPVLFYPNYDKIYKNYNKGKETGDTAVYREHMMIKSVLKKLDARETIHSVNDGKGHTIPSLGRKEEVKVVITTNIPVDLFNFKCKLDLLESHTGKLKTPSMFNSKYHTVGKLDLSHLPWVEELVYLLGEDNIVLPTKLGTRRRVIELSKEYNWTPLTTREKVVSNLKRDKDLATFVRQFSKQYK